MNKIRNWPTRALYGFVALAMVLSLVLLGGAAPMAGTTETVAAEDFETNPSRFIPVYRADAGPDIPELVVDIERPASGTSFNVSDTFYVNAVVAYKDIELKDAAYKSVTATIDTGQYAALVTGETPSKSATILRNCVGDFWWKVECTGEGPTVITVTAEASGLTDGVDSVTVTQGEPELDCDLEITMMQPTGDDCYVEVCHNFVVKAKIENKSSTTATNVTACIDIDPDTGAEVTGGEPHCWNVGDILAGRYVYVLWNMHCTDDGAVNITVDATAGGVTNICPAYVVVHQGEEPPIPSGACLNVTVDAPTEVCTQGCGYNSFNVTTTITHNGNCAGNCSNITATISKTVGGSLASITGPLQKDAGTLMPGNSTTVTWNVTCTGLGAVTFKVVAQGEEDNCIGEDTATVQQKRILIDLIEPESGVTIYHNICQTFNVTANITNCDCFGLQNVTVQLDLPDSVCITENTTIHVTHYDENGDYVGEYEIDPEDLDDPEKIIFPSFCMCCIYTIEWTDLHCCDETPDYGQTAEEVYIKVWDGDENLMDEDYFRVKQTEKAHLAAGVETYLGTSNATGPSACHMSTTPATAVAVNQSFVVVVPVINMGMAAAQNVSVNVTITGNATCAGNNISFDLGTIPGRSAKKAFISCNCSADGAVNITISGLAGNDSVKRINHPNDPDLYAIPEDNLYPCGNRVLKQIPIIIEIVQPDDGEHFTCCDDFVVKVKISNDSAIPGNDLTEVIASINWTGPASFNPGAPSGYWQKELGALPAGNHTYVGWNFHCDDDEDVVFTITIESTDPAWSDTVEVTVHQDPNAVLEVHILSPMSGSAYRTSEEFAVTANVTVVSANLSFVEDVEAYISPCSALAVLGSTSIDLGTMQEGESQIVSWTVHAVEAGSQCAPEEDCYIYVNAVAPCTTMGTHYKIVTIYPTANLLVEITDYPEEDIVVCSTFNVTARVTNIGWADATEAKLLLSVIPDGSVRPYPPQTYEEPIDTLLGYGQSDVENVGYKEVTWTLHCKVACESTIIITPVGYDECGWHPVLDQEPDGEAPRGNNGAPPVYVMVSQPGRAIEDKFLHADSVTVKQVEPTQLAVDITYPSDGAEFYGGDEPDSFVVTAKITNNGEQEATAVNATIAIRDGDPAELVTPPAQSQIIASIPAGESKAVSWNLLAGNASGSVVITVTAVGPNTALDVVTVKIDPAPVQALFEGANPIAYQGQTGYLPEVLTNITDQLVIIWQRDATTGGDWHTFYFYGVYPEGEIEKLVENSAYIVVVSENCEWNLAH